MLHGCGTDLSEGYLPQSFPCSLSRQTSTLLVGAVLRLQQGVRPWHTQPHMLGRPPRDGPDAGTDMLGLLNIQPGRYRCLPGGREA